MRDVARVAGVSQRTVSNVVNAYQHVKPATRERVLAAMAELGYVPNAAARSLRAGRTGLLTLAVSGFEERYFADLTTAVVRHAENLGYTVLIEITGGERERELQVLGGGRDQLTDGAIMSALRLVPGDERYRRPGYPLVLIGDQEPGGPIHHVGVPNYAGARAAVEHLISLGRERIMLLGRSGPTETSGRLREQGYVDALTHAGLPVREDLVVEVTWTRPNGLRAVTEVLTAGAERPDAIFAMNDSLAIGALRALTTHGVRVPEDVAIVGFDDIDETRFTNPSLTSISPDVDELARRAVGLFDAQVNGTADRDAGTHVTVDYHLNVRESTAGE